MAIFFYVPLIQDVFGSEQIRKIQEELHKRHLFYGDITGEVSPALTGALRRYQERKGFERTGVINSETCLSLGIAEPPVQVKTAFVVDENGDTRGMNGEALERPLPSRWATDERNTRFGPARIVQGDVARVRVGSNDKRASRDEIAARGGSSGPARRLKSPKEKNPIVLAYNSVDHAIKFLFRDPEGKKRHRSAKRF